MPEKQKPESLFGIRVAPAVAGVIAGIAAPATAHGGVILSNLSDPVQFPPNVLVSQGMPAAQSFLTGPLAVSVQSIIIDLVPEKKGGSGNFVASLYTDLSGNPGSDMGDSAPINDQVGDLDFLFASPVPLAANTHYWVVLSCDKDCPEAWATTSSPAQTSDVGATFQGDVKDFNGSSWVNATGQSPSVGLLEIDGETAAPEPGGFSLAALGGASIAWFARRRKRS